MAEYTRRPMGDNVLNSNTLDTMKPIYFSCLLLLLPSVTLSQTLCREGEIDYFSCNATSSKKIISVCGNITNGEINDNSWLQYRFGKVSAIELAYPQEKAGSISKFEGNHFNKYGVIDLRFINRTTLYGVHLNEPYSGDDATKRTKYSGGMSAEIGKIKRVNIDCTKVAGQKYYEIFSGLNASLRHYNSGNTDFLFHFYNRVAK